VTAARLVFENVSGGYGSTVIVRDLSGAAEAGAVLCVLGRNGVGKSTLMKLLFGYLPCRAGRVLLDGKPIGAHAAADIVKLGIALVPEGRRLFPSLTVEENLLIGGHSRKKPGPWSLDRVYSLFPILKQRRSAATPTLSGGQQQMAAIGRALMSNPRVLLCDEISLGLAPIIIADIYAALPRIKAEGTSVVLVEQDIVQAMKVADRVYCFQEGRLSLEGRPSELTRDQIHRAYFGA